MNRSTPGLPVHHQLLEFTQTHVHPVSDAIQPSHPLSSPSPPAPNPSQQQSLFQWVNSSHEVAGWHHWLDGRESEWTPGVGDGQGGLACCDSWGRKESTELNWTKLSGLQFYFTVILFFFIEIGLIYNVVFQMNNIWFSYTYIYICVCVYILIFTFYSIIGYY